MNLDFDTIEIPEEKLNRTIQNNIKKVHGIHRKQMIRHTAGLFCAAAFFFCLSAIFLHSNPSLAADLLHLFEKIENKQIFSGDLHTHATPLTNNNSQKSDGYTYPRHIVIHRTFMSVSRLHLKKVFQKANEHK